MPEWKIPEEKANSLVDLIDFLIEKAQPKEDEQLDPNKWYIDKQTFQKALKNDQKEFGVFDANALWLMKGALVDDTLPPYTMRYEG